MTHAHAEIDRLQFEYWLTGNGSWATRWLCTNKDLPLAIVTVALFSLLVLMYWFYARQNRLATKVVREATFVKHLRHLCHVFLLCGTLHATGRIVAYVLPIYWIDNIICAITVYKCVGLIKSKSLILAIQRHMDGEHAIELVDDALQQIQRSEGRQLRQTLDQLEHILTRERDVA